MNPLIAALLAAGVISDEEARTLNGLLNDGATRIEAEQRIAASFASGFENQRSRLIRALDMGNVDYRDPMLPAFWAAEHDLLARDVLPTLTGIAQDVALTATVRSGGLADWRTVNEAVIAWTDSHYRSVAGDALGSIPNLDNTARDAVADAVNRWQRGELNAGPGRGGLPRLIAELQNVEEFGVDRAARIAVTETTRIFAESERTAAQANPNMEYLVWQTSSDEATCLICAPMEGQRIPKGQTTFPGGYYPPAHPNCRCGVTAVTEVAAEVLSGAAVPGQVAPLVDTSLTSTAGYQAPEYESNQVRARTEQDIRKNNPRMNDAAVAQRMELYDKAVAASILPEDTVSIRIKDKSLLKMLGEDEPRFKSQFETGKSGGVNDPRFRSLAEEFGLGYSRMTPDAERPIYGYVGANTNVSSYGNVEVVLKQSVRPRTSITFGDSLIEFNRSGEVGTPMNAPRLEGAGLSRMAEAVAPHSPSDVVGIANTLRNNTNVNGYVEAQVHGGVTVADFDKVIFHGKKPSPALIESLDKYGIAWERVGDEK